MLATFKKDNNLSDMKLLKILKQRINNYHFVQTKSREVTLQFLGLSLESLQGQNSLILESFQKSLNKKTYISKPKKITKYFKSVHM